jgi:DNA-binding transcriptional ArsR family regulator
MLLETATRTLDLQAKLFRGFADPSRLAILNALRAGPLHVGAIVAATGLSQSNVSNHLRCLSECGLVQAEPRGRFVHYRLGDTRVGKLLRLAEELLAGASCGVEACGRYERPEGRQDQR